MKSIASVFVWVMVVSSVHGQSVASTGASCELQCKNGGSCAMMQGTVDDLSQQAQSGHLIEYCICPTGFTGTVCEQVVEECSLPERKCRNGAPCTQNAAGGWGCECSAADSISSFAGFQCRNMITEYCSGKYDPTAPVLFCTNGGRCEADFLAAQVAPGDTSLNRAYQDLGCRCPRDFYGPHCEFLKVSSEQDAPAPTQANKRVQSPAIAVFLSLFSFCLLLLGFLIRKKLKTKRVPREISVEHTVATSWGNGYDEYRYNGRHHRPSPYNSQNLHVPSVFEDVVIA